MGKAADFFVPNNGKDPEAANTRYHLRGNGVWKWKPELTAGFDSVAHSVSNLVPLNGGGVTASRASEPAEIVFKIDGANVITALKVRGKTGRSGNLDSMRLAVSTVNGLAWKEIWQSDLAGNPPFDLTLTNQVNGAYEVLVKVSLRGA